MKHRAIAISTPVADISPAVAGAVPLLVGTAIFVAWCITGEDYLEPAGIYTISAGLGSIAAGAICMTIYLRRSGRSAPRHRLVWRSVAIAGLFISDFVAAAAYTVTAIAIETRYDVLIANQWTQALRDARIDGGTTPVYLDLGEILPGATVEGAFWVEHEGPLFLRASGGDDMIAVVVDAYVTGNMGGDLKVVIDAAGKVSAEKR